MDHLTSQTTFLSVAALGLAVCAGIYVLWGPDWFRKRGHFSMTDKLHCIMDVCFDMQVVALVSPILGTLAS